MTELDKNPLPEKKGNRIFDKMLETDLGKCFVTFLSFLAASLFFYSSDVPELPADLYKVTVIPTVFFFILTIVCVIFELLSLFFRLLDLIEKSGRDK